MSTTVLAKELTHQDRFEMPDGSVFILAGDKDGAKPRQAKLWCSHAPTGDGLDATMIDLAPDQAVRVLSASEADAHYAHDGFAESVFRREMDRRHVAMMKTVGDRQNLADTEQRQREHANRPWWKKLLG